MVVLHSDFSSIRGMPSASIHINILDHAFPTSIYYNKNPAFPMSWAMAMVQHFQPAMETVLQYGASRGARL
jgi:hypothetical protein